jgi:hypothetical protein
MRLASQTLAACALALFLPATAPGAALPLVRDVEWQPLSAQIQRLVEATEFVGSPLSAEDRAKLDSATRDADPQRAVVTAQTVLDAYCLAAVTINPEMRVKVAQGPAKPVLVEKGWRTFLVKIHNESGTTAELRAVSPNATSLFEGGWSAAPNPSDAFFRPKNDPTPRKPESELWLALEMFTGAPMKPTLSGLKLEYGLVQLYSRDAGKREGKLAFNVGQGTQDIGFRNEIDVLFDCQPSASLELEVLDEHRRPTTASFTIRDKQGRVYPPPSKRLAPDFAFHHQVYRANGEKLALPSGDYTIEFTRGPEYLTKTTSISVTQPAQRASFVLERWIDPSTLGWWSGDHHIHAAGCAHYTKPSEGVHAPDMMRHILGEDLKVGCNLTWGPCFDYQKQFFTGKDDKVSRYPYLLRYDIEVSGFGSHESGHLCLLRLKDQMYPGGDSKHHWPKLGLNTLRWAKQQGAVCGPAHSGWGLEVNSTELPNYLIPPFNGIGANEYIVDVTHEVPGPDGKLVPAVDFISTVDTPHLWELNIWYHTLNVGFRTRISGETDFPCIYGERVGLGRSYVKLDGELDYDAWCEGIRQGRNYVGDGKSHLIGFQASDVRMGEQGSELRIAQPGKIRLTAKAAARLNEKPDPALQNRAQDKKPYWDIERARIKESREVPVEVVVNGIPVARQQLVADGQLRDLAFDVQIDRSSWVALRILPSSHTNPIFVLVDGKPVRASVRSAEWCLSGVDKCWAEKERTYKGPEVETAKQAYEHARLTYRRLIADCRAAEAGRPPTASIDSTAPDGRVVATAALTDTPAP